MSKFTQLWKIKKGMVESEMAGADKYHEMGDKFHEMAITETRYIIQIYLT